MGTPLDHPYAFGAAFDEATLRRLSMQQNGDADLVVQKDPSGTVTGFASAYPIEVDHHVVTSAPVDLAAYVSAAHVALRDGGVTVGSMRIRTDSESRGLIDGAYALSQAQPNTAIDFKAASGWVTIDATTMQMVAVAVGRWVQACYSAYRQIDGKVADGTFTTPAQVDAAFAAVTLPT